ncbi:hypothetical protein SLA2020_319370 [Shorea laevis]
MSLSSLTSACGFLGLKSRSLNLHLYSDNGSFNGAFVLFPKRASFNCKKFSVSCSSSSSPDPLLVKAARGQLSQPPAWIMRQAGRYMAVYRKLAEKYTSFRERSETTDLNCENFFAALGSLRPDGVTIFFGHTYTSCFWFPI